MRYLVASHEATDTLHRSMSLAPYLPVVPHKIVAMIAVFLPLPRGTVPVSAMGCHSKDDVYAVRRPPPTCHHHY